jgi:enterochelin esterase family protein
MKSIVFVVLSLSARLTSTAFAQRAPTDTGGGVVSPEVHPDRTVTFRLRAPNAADVTLTGDWLASPEKLTKDANGVWSVTLGPLEPGLAIYTFTADGTGMADPANPRVKLRARGSGSLAGGPESGDAGSVAASVAR